LTLSRVERVALVERENKTLPLRNQAELLGLSRSSLYYQSRSPSARKVRIKHRIDEIYTQYPFYGSRKIHQHLQREGEVIGKNTVADYMRQMGIEAIFPGPNLSKRAKSASVYPYLLRNVTAGFPNHVWGIDITYIRLQHGWMYLVAVLDWYSRYIISWQLCTTMKAEDVTNTLDLALQASGCDQAAVLHKPRLLSDNGSSYIAGELADWLEDRQMDHVRGAPYHPQTQGKIERWHQTLKNRILLENYYLPGDLRQQIDTFVDHYNHRRYHESLHNLTPADVYFGRAQTILKQRERIKRKTIETRRLLHRKSAA
jgi:transposase InsO family protein